jgi:ferritin-like metal-binding protein YciE
MAKFKNDAATPNRHLEELFVDELKDILGAEKQLLKGLKKLSTNGNPA